MKILQAIASVAPEGGGPVESLKQVGKEIVSRGHQIDVVSLDDPGETFLEDFPLPIMPLGPSTTFYRYTPKLVPWLKENHSNYDCVIVRGIWRYNSFGVWRALQGTNTPYFIFTHGMLDPWFKRHYPLKHLKKWAYWPWGEYRVLRDAQAVLFTSEEEKTLARESFSLYSCNEEVVSYGTSGPPEVVENLQMKFFEKNPALRDKRIVLFMGRIHEKKGCDLLIEAFAPHAKDDPNLHLVFAGPDQVGWKRSLEHRIEQLGISHSVTWTGMLSGDAKWEALAGAEVFILPSHQENFGIVVAEALACSVPVLITDKVNIWREVKEAGAGVIQPDTLDGVRSLLTSWLEFSSQERAAMRDNALACFQANFGIETAASGLISTLSRHLAPAK